jgi:hypothetical protein
MHNQKTASMLDNIINFNISGLVINDHWFPFKIDKAINYINNGSHFFFMEISCNISTPVFKNE